MIKKLQSLFKSSKANFVEELRKLRNEDRKKEEKRVKQLIRLEVRKQLGKKK